MMLEEFLFNIAMLFLALACVIWIQKQIIKVIIWFLKNEELSSRKVTQQSVAFLYALQSSFHQFI